MKIFVKLLTKNEFCYIISNVETIDSSAILTESTEISLKVSVLLFELFELMKEGVTL